MGYAKRGTPGKSRTRTVEYFAGRHFSSRYSIFQLPSQSSGQSNPRSGAAKCRRGLDHAVQGHVREGNDATRHVERDNGGLHRMRYRIRLLPSLARPPRRGGFVSVSRRRGQRSTNEMTSMSARQTTITEIANNPILSISCTSYSTWLFLVA